MIGPLAHELAVDDGFDRHVGVGCAMEAEILRQNARHGRSDFIQQNGASDEIRLTVEKPFPARVREPHDRRRPDAIIFSPQVPSARNVRTQYTEEVLRHLSDGDLFRGSSGPELGTFGTIDCESTEEIGTGTPIDKIRIRHAHVVGLTRAFGHMDESVRLRIRQRPQARVIDQAENRGVSADAQREREDNEGGEPRRFAEQPQSQAEIIHGLK